MVEQDIPHMLSAGVLVNAQVVDVQRPDRAHVGGKRRLLHNAECVSHHLAAVVLSHEYRSFVVTEYVVQLLPGVLRPAGYEDVRAQLRVQLQHLAQQLHCLFGVLFFRSSYSYHNVPLLRQ